MRSIATTTAALVGTALLLGACAEDIPEIFIAQNQAIGDDCAPATGAAVASQGAGILDVFLATQYDVTPLIESTLVPSNSVEYRGLAAGAGGLFGNEWEANLITLNRATVELDIPAAVGVAVARSFDIQISGSITPGGQTVVPLTAITPPVVNVLRSSPLIRQSLTTPVTILARIKVSGRTSAGNTVGSNEFTYPINVCYGCLLDVPPDAIDPSLPTPNCRAPLAENLQLEPICRRGQDRPVDCRQFCPTLGPNVEDLTGICVPR